MNEQRKYRELVHKSKVLRENPTKAEQILLNAIKASKLSNQFEFQHVIFPYIVDFAFLNSQLIVEVDGEIHNQKSNSDDIRDHELARSGWRTLRFKNAEVLEDVSSVISRIQFETNFLKSKKPPDQSINKRAKKRPMVIPLPRLVYEEPVRPRYRTRAGKVSYRRTVPKGQPIRAICQKCKNPIADADPRVKFQGDSEITLWVHKSCK